MRTRLSYVAPYVVMICTFLFGCAPLSAKLTGKADLGAAYAEIKIINSGSTVKTLHMRGFGGNVTVAVYKCFCLKPRFLVLTGNGDYHTIDLGAGIYIPISRFSVMPNVGISHSILKFLIDIPAFGLANVGQKFRTWNRYVGIDGSWKITDKIGLVVSVQHAWSRNRTTVGTLVSSRTESKGFNITVMIDYYLTDHWSINFAAADMRSMGKEKDGSTGKGARLGLGYCF